MNHMIDIRQFGAVGDGATVNTRAVQAAIDECSRQGRRRAGGGRAPACGLYAAHIRGLTLRNVQLRTAAGDARPAIFCHDVQDADLSEQTDDSRIIKI